MKLEEFDNWFEIWRKILLDLNISIMNTRYLLTIHENDIQQGKNSGFFDYHTSQLRFIVVIQLCKIFDNSSNQKRNVHKLFNRLINEKLDIMFNEKLKENQESDSAISSIDQMIKKVHILKDELENHSELIKKIVIGRNKIYAHTDPEFTRGEYSWAQLDILVDFSNRIYNEIYGGINNTNTLFKLNPGYSVAEILLKLRNSAST
ncbi:hypothetical protein [Gillisia sp. CAL575]|uniref:AbiU2 domain-containing protein n=1 Tax=Gillisia sp. CAL575 TaxID=985255 RepID=UPI000555B340|nr:hypothetical protein [Gillisia sp. CAL575]